MASIYITLLTYYTVANVQCYRTLSARANIFKPNQEAKQDTSYVIKSVEKQVNKIQQVEQESMKKVS